MERIFKLTTQINKKTLHDILKIHEACILKNTSKTYSPEIIEDLLSTLSVENIKEQLENSSWIVLEKENKVLGFAQYSLKDEKIFQIQIEPKKQKQGYGGKLFNYIEKEFKRNNIENITIFSKLDTVNFYKKLGFESIKNIQYPLKNNSIEMVKMKRVLK